MEVPAIDERDREIFVLERARGVESAETTADDDGTVHPLL
jgi:hypothetical protein